MHAKGSGAYGTFTVTHDITKYTKAKIFSTIGKKTDLFLRFSTVAGERGAADAERDIRGTESRAESRVGPAQRLELTREHRSIAVAQTRSDAFLTMKRTRRDRRNAPC